MHSLTDYLSSYAAYHRDRRNIATHFVGIPLIVISLFTLLGGVHVSLAWALAIASSLFYLRVDLRFGLVMVAFSTLSMLAALPFTAWSRAGWLVAGISMFVVGWVFQFIGHAFEGRKPAFVDDLVGLLIGPLFIVSEAAFALGLRRSVAEEVIARAGPTRSQRPLMAKL